MSEHKIVIVGGYGVGKTSYVEKIKNEWLHCVEKHTIGDHYVTTEYYKDVVGVFVMVDIQSEVSFELARQWKQYFDTKLLKKPVILLINKCDLISNLKMNYDDFCRQHVFAKWYLISVKSYSSEKLLAPLHDLIEFYNARPIQKPEDPKNLSDQLSFNTANSVKQRQQYINDHYPQLQSHVVDLLLEHSRTYHCLKYRNYKCEIEIGDLYIKDYYDDTDPVEYTVLGKSFANGCKSEPSYLTLDELENLTSQLEKYLKSQGLEVKYTSHCCIEVSWKKA